LALGLPAVGYALLFFTMHTGSANKDEVLPPLLAAFIGGIAALCGLGMLPSYVADRRAHDQGRWSERGDRHWMHPAEMLRNDALALAQRQGRNAVFRLVDWEKGNVSVDYFRGDKE
jgi:hypothetical protein